MSRTPQVSIVLASYNRRAVVLNTIDRLGECGLPPREREIIVVDNASSDGTAEALRHDPRVRLVALNRNLGSCAKALGVEQARAPFLLFLDDDSYPRPGAMERMLRHFEADPRLGAAGFTVRLPDGAQECSALPHVFVGCGIGLRTSALRGRDAARTSRTSVGNLDRSFFMQAEEYDLSFRLLAAGWNVEILGDLAVEHLKSPQARRGERTTYYDVRNNLRVVSRYLPRRYARVYRQDWLQRYRWLAEAAGHMAAFRRGQLAGTALGAYERFTHRRWRLPVRALESVFRWSFVESRMMRLAARGVRRIVLADLGKNAYAFVRGAQRAGVAVSCIADHRFARPDRYYRGIPVIAIDAALRLPADAIVVSNTSYVHAQRRCDELRRRRMLPVYNWFDPPAADESPLCLPRSIPAPAALRVPVSS